MGATLNTNNTNNDNNTNNENNTNNTNNDNFVGNEYYIIVNLDEQKPTNNGYYQMEKEERTCRCILL